MSDAALRTLVQVRDLRFAWPDGTCLFDAWQADIGPGLTLLRGAMGSGKTTLLKLLGQPSPAKGEIVLAGRSLVADPLRWHREVDGLDAQDPSLDDFTPPALMAKSRQRHPGFDGAAWQGHVDAFGLGPHLAKPLRTLSTGTRRKAMLAVALSSRATLTLLDEPGAGLDGASLRHLTLALRHAAADPDRAVVVADSQQLLRDLPWASLIELQPFDD